jgi:hypothetical protein
MICAVSKSIDALMFTPAMPIDHSFFKTSVALMPMPRARSAMAMVSSMRMTRLCSAGVVRSVAWPLPFIEENGSFFLPKS